MRMISIVTTVVLTAFASSIFAQAPVYQPSKAILRSPKDAASSSSEQAISQLREPVYRGKTLSAWLDAYPYSIGIGDGFGGHRAEDQADEAVRQIGTNALPTLLQRLGACDSTLKVKIMDIFGVEHPDAAGVTSPAISQNRSWSRSVILLQVLRDIAFILNQPRHGCR